VTLLVTGATGFIGRRVVRLAESDIVRLDHRWDDIHQLRRILPAVIDSCIHLAWTASSTDYLTNANSNQASFSASLDLLRVLAERECRHIVVAGSCAEYAKSGVALREESPLQADSAYAYFKIRFHESLSQFGIPFAWTRLFSVVGPGEPARRLSPSVVRSLLNHTELPLSPGDQVRDLIDVDDAARALIALSGTRQVGVFNVCRGEGVVLRDFLLLIAHMMRADNSILKFGARPYGRLDPLCLVGDPIRLRTSVPKWMPKFDTPKIASRVINDVLDGKPIE
jgi:nucleoside-diphosphate-sugar epimerase